jgi:hypothetical protein
MNALDLQELLASALLRRFGGTKRAWRVAVGPVRTYDPATHPHCNWAVSPSGTPGQNAAIEQLLDELRARHPIVLPA